MSIDPEALGEDGHISREEINRQYNNEVTKENVGNERFQEDLSDLVS